MHLPLATHAGPHRPGPYVPGSRRLLTVAWLLLPVACSSRQAIEEVPADEGSRRLVTVTLDANTRVASEARRLKFWVDVHNGTESDLDVTRLRVELTASPVGVPDTISLRKCWSYAWQSPLEIAPGRRITLPIVPETRRTPGPRGELLTISEFPLAQLVEGDYEIRAVVDERFTSPPYRISVVHPSPAAWGPRAVSASHRGSRSSGRLGADG